MKRLLYSILILVMFLPCTGCGISSSEAEKIIIKRFSHTNSSGSFRPIRTDIKVPNAVIIKMIEEGELIFVGEKRSGFGSLKRTIYQGNKGLKAVIDWKYTYRRGPVTRNMAIKDNGFKYSKTKFAKFGTCKFVKVPLLEKHFVGITKTWKDKRKGYSDRSYVTYRTKIKVNKDKYDAIKGLNATIYTNTDVPRQRLRSTYHKYVSLDRYISIIKAVTKTEHERSFRKDSQGNWR